MAEPMTPDEVAAHKDGTRERLRSTWGWPRWRERDLRVPEMNTHGVHLLTVPNPEGPMVTWQHPEGCQCALETDERGG